MDVGEPVWIARLLAGPREGFKVSISLQDRPPVLYKVKWGGNRTKVRPVSGRGELSCSSSQGRHISVCMCLH